MTEIDESVLLGDGSDVHDGPIDENALLEEDQIKDMKEEQDLYDDAIAPSNTSAVETVTLKLESSPAPSVSSTSITKSNSNLDGRKYCCYIGNLVWYTTDADLMKALSISGLSYNQFADMKFFENRTNGQSKGYALLVLNSEAAVRQVMETLPNKQIHGQSPTVLSYNKINQAKLEDAQAKSQTRPDAKKKPMVPTTGGFVQQEDGCVNMGTIRIGAPSQNRNGPSNMSRNGPPPLMMQTTIRQPPILNNSSMGGSQVTMRINGQPVQPPMMNRPPMAPTQGIMGSAPMQLNPQMQTQPPTMIIGGQTMNLGQQRPMMQPPMMQPPMLGMPMTAPPPGMAPTQYQTRPPQLGQPMGAPPSIMQINTSMRPPANGMAPVHVNPHMFPGMQGQPLSEAEFEDIMNRNRSVSSSALSRAFTDASTGDLKGASETILTAISLLKQSRVSHDDRCRALVFQLEDTLRSLESKGVYMSSSSSRSKSHRDRSRSRDRKRRRRSRSRSRSYSRSPSPRRRRY